MDPMQKLYTSINTMSIMGFKYIRNYCYARFLLLCQVFASTNLRAFQQLLQPCTPLRCSECDEECGNNHSRPIPWVIGRNPEARLSR